MSTDKRERVVEFFEQPRDDGSIEVSWHTNTSRDWKRILKLIKGSIVQGERAFDPDKKTWIISSSAIHIYEDIKSAMLAQDNEQLGDVDEKINNETMARLMGNNLMELPLSMRKRAVFAIQAVMGIVDTEVEYCVSEGVFGAWNESENVWMYENGRYSGSSPSTKDEKATQRAMKRIHDAYEKLDGVMETLDDTGKDSWKRRFRNSMLERYDYRCYTCLERPKKISHLHMHRVQPGREGGVYIEDNVVLLCVNCHRAYEGNSWEFFHDTHNKVIAS